MNEKKKLMFDEIRRLCIINGKAIDKIARDTNNSCDLVGKMFIETMQEILNMMS